MTKSSFTYIIDPEAPAKVSAMNKKMKTKTNATHRVVSIKPNESKNNLSRFCGKWKDDREADDIIADIYKDRTENNCSGRKELIF